MRNLTIQLVTSGATGLFDMFVINLLFNFGRSPQKFLYDFANLTRKHLRRGPFLVTLKTKKNGQCPEISVNYAKL